MEQPVAFGVFSAHTHTHTHPKLQAAPMTVHVAFYYKSYIDALNTVLPHTGDDKMLKRLFHATMHSLMMDQ